MVRRFFEEQIRELLEDLLEMGQMVTNSIRRSVQALSQQDVELARQVVAYDDEVNAIQQEIDEKCLVLLATQQPMASDLRAILAISNIAAELERIGDYAKGIGKINLLIGTAALVKPLATFPRASPLKSTRIGAAEALVERTNIATDISAARRRTRIEFIVSTPPCG